MIGKLNIHKKYDLMCNSMPDIQESKITSLKTLNFYLLDSLLQDMARLPTALNTN